jgi:predicted glutamine amidotransferase
MCRLGFISSKNPTQVGVLIENATRHYGDANPHGIGFSYTHGHEVHTVKSPSKARDFWAKHDYSDLKTKEAIFHVRFASVGSICTLNTHPIANKQFSLVHNGTLSNWEYARDVLKKEGYKFETTVDSEVLLAAWTFYKEDFLKFLKSKGVSGWYTILILSKDGKIRAITNSGYLVVFKRENDVIGFSDTTFKNLRKKYKIKENVLYTFGNGRLIKKKQLDGWGMHERPKITVPLVRNYGKPRTLLDDREFIAWLESRKKSHSRS